MDHQDYVKIAGLRVSRCLHEFIETEAAPGTGVSPDHFWEQYARILDDFAPLNKQLLAFRDDLQSKIDDWYSSGNGSSASPAEVRSFLESIGYIVPEGPDFTVEVENVDPEIAMVNAPQLVVPIDNARYAINAVNSRWGSLYDALYSSGIADSPEDIEVGPGYDPVRGAKVIEWSKNFLDRIAPLESGSHASVSDYAVERDPTGTMVLKATMVDGSTVNLVESSKFAGFRGLQEQPDEVLLCNHGLRLRLQIDRDGTIGKSDPAGIQDIFMESAVTTIQDFEDAIAAVDAQDKTHAYRNWLKLMNGSLSFKLKKNGTVVNRTLLRDIEFTGPNGQSHVLPVRSMMFVRHVGLYMYTDAVTTSAGEETPEGILDAMVVTLCAVHDLKHKGDFGNSRYGSVYVVKPKLHGPEEVEATVKLFERVEQALDIPRNTLKIGIMDEERRTTVNLKECIRVAKHRVVFVNTGFLDRTGDEIHTLMKLGAVIPKESIKQATWLKAYENWNVDIALATGLHKTGQIGKGMWTMPDKLNTLYQTKIIHPQTGASTAWVPSPTSATIHALHYHEVDVDQLQSDFQTRARAKLEDILTPPLLAGVELSKEEIQSELTNNIQGILGYVVHWVEKGLGCSKIPDINNVNLMEDRATLRISSQHIANWLAYGIVTTQQIESTLREMAIVVDKQNAEDPKYKKMSADYDSSCAFQAARDLIFQGGVSANGYTEDILTRYRRMAKSRAAEQST